MAENTETETTSTNPLIAALYDTVEEPTVEPTAEPAVESEQPESRTHDPRPENRSGSSLSDFTTDLGEDGLPKEGGAMPEVEQEEVVEETEVKKGLTYKKDSEDPGVLPTFESSTPEPEVKVEKEESELELLPEEAEQLELAKFASSNMSEFKGLDKKFEQFFQRHRDFVDKQLTEDPDVQFDSNNEEYQRFLEINRPGLTSAQVRKIDREMVKSELREEQQKAHSIREEELETKLRTLETQPQVTEELNKFQGDLYKTVPADLKKVMDEQGEVEARKQFPLEFEASDQVLGNTFVFGEELLKINNKLVKYDPRGNEVHRYLRDFIEGQGQTFHQQGGNLRVRDGKQFLPASSYAQAIQAGQSQNYWTFKDTDILDMMKLEATRQISQRIKAEKDRIVAAGYVRPGSSKPPASTSAPAPRSAPRSTTSQTEGGQKSSFLDVLGY